MMDFIMVPAVMAIITLGIYKLFELFVCKKERLLLLEKMADQQMYPKRPDFKPYDILSFSALKIGSLLTGMGLGLLVGYLLCVTTLPGYLSKDQWDYRQTVSLIYGACVLLFGGIGLIIAFITELKLSKKKE